MHPTALPATTTIASRPRPIGELPIQRLLPSSRRRMVGPFIFLDHMGPVTLSPGRGVNVPPHPHIGLATVTYLFEGALTHRDSLGSVQAIRPGDVNWMTAGRGIAHSERSPDAARAAGATLHGLQAWVALPEGGDTGAEDGRPAFHHHPAATLPTLEADGMRATLIAGTALGERSPVAVASPLYYLDIRLSPGAVFDLPAEHAEHAVYPIDGRAEVAGVAVPPQTMLVLDGPGPWRATTEGGCRLVAMGGMPLGRRLIWWNFVASDQGRIEAAKAAWRDGRFAPVPGETEFVPLPEA
jgi:redox-sensitive bicupin YhaK (pirin superfamily)